MNSSRDWIIAIENNFHSIPYVAVLHFSPQDLSYWRNGSTVYWKASQNNRRKASRLESDVKSHFQDTRCWFDKA